MNRVAGGIIACALLAGAIACTSDDPSADPPPTKNVAVDPDDVERHEAAPGTPLAFGIEVPDGATQVGPLVRQRRTEVADVIGGPSSRADAFGNDQNDDANPRTRDPEEPTPPDFTTAMLRVDGDPSEVVESTLSELSDALAGSEIDAENWQKYCTISDGVYTGCRLHARGTTDDDERVSVELTIDPGDPSSKTAPAGSLLRPVMVLTLEHVVAPDEKGDEKDTDPADAQAREAQAAIDAREAEEAAKAAAAAEKRSKNAKNGRNTQTDDTSGDKSPEADETSSEETEGQDADKADKEPTWPTMKREWPVEPGKWILTPQWKVRPNTEVILSSSTPEVAMLAVKSGGDADAIARRYIRAFSDEATTPKLDEVEDLNERNVTYTPRNDGSGPSVAVTTVATGRGNYIELLFSDGNPDAGNEHPYNSPDKDAKPDGGKSKGGKKSDKSAANRTTSKTD